MKYSLRESGVVLIAARCNATLRVDRGQKLASANQQLMCDAEPLGVEACHRGQPSSSSSTAVVLTRTRGCLLKRPNKSCGTLIRCVSCQAAFNAPLTLLKFWLSLAYRMPLFDRHYPSETVQHSKSLQLESSTSLI